MNPAPVLQAAPPHRPKDPAPDLHVECPAPRVCPAARAAARLDLHTDQVDHALSPHAALPSLREALCPLAAQKQIAMH